MDPKERATIVSDIQEDLASVIGASGNPTKLVGLTTSIVKGAKRLVEGVPEELSTRSTASLTAFIKSAQVIAKNPRGADSKAIQELSTTRKAVEKVVEDLDKWHANASRRTSPVMELNEVVDAIVKKPQDNRRSSPEEPVDSERTQKLTWELQRKRDVLLLKMEPQKAPSPVGQVNETLMTAVKGLMRGADEITAHSEKKLPTKDVILEPMILITEMVCSLLDVVDSLFVSKYPMRSQVYSFCTALIDNVLAYGCRSKSDDLTSLRSISTQTPALLNAAKVMVEQCEKRSNSLDESREMSIRRGHDFDELEIDGIHSKKVKKPPPPEPPVKQEVKTEFEIYCNVCTSVAVDQKTQQPITKGTELSLMVLPTTTVRDIKQDLSSRTGLPFENIQFNQGQSELSDSAVINPQSMYFLFNRYEPSEEEILELRKHERKKNRMKIYDLDWSQVKGPIAVALYEYDTLGDDSNLAFDEGDVIEIIEKGGDGWWEGRIDDKSGSFPASFVEEIHSRDEGVRLVELMKRGRQQGHARDHEDDDNTRAPHRQTSDAHVHSGQQTKEGGPAPKIKKKTLSTPDFSAQLMSMDKNRMSGLFKKKKQTRSGYSNLEVFDENEQEKPESPEPPRGPKMKPKPLKGYSRSVRVPKLLGSDSAHSPATTPTSNSPVPDVDKCPSPQMNYRRGSGESNAQKRRPPPPRPPPFASTHPVQAAKLEKIIRSQQSEEQEPTPKEEEVKFAVSAESEEKTSQSSSPVPPPSSGNETEPSKSTGETSPTEDSAQQERSMKKGKDTSSSMEDLLQNLKEFDESTKEHSYATLSEVQVGGAEYDVDYEVISPPAYVPESPKEVVTIKISDYKPDTDDELLDDEDEEDHDGFRGNDEERKESVDGLLFAEDDHWKPREWAPSPEPEPRCKSKKLKPSWSVDVAGGGDSRKLSSQSKPVPAPKPITGLSSSPQLSARGDPGQGRQGSPLPPPTIIARPRKSPGSSPQMVARHDRPANEDKTTPPPVPPPRQKKQKPGVVPPPNRPAPPPPKPKGFSSSRSDMDLRGAYPHKPTSTQQQSHIGERRWTVSQQREQLRYKLPSRPRSPVVQRKTKAVMGEESHLTMSSLPEMTEEDFTGVGKQGVLLKESSTSSITEWKSRYFHLVEDGLLYFDSTESASRASRPLGELQLNRMVKAIPVGEKNQLQCFAILMKYETSIILGCHSKLELEDWLGSLNQLIEVARLKDMPPSYLPSIKAAEDCLEYLLSTPVTMDKNVFKLSGDFGVIKGWLQDIDGGEEVDFSVLGNPGTALCMLKSLLTDNKLGHLVPAAIAKEISLQVKKSSPVRDIQSKLHHLPDESLHILQMFLKLFSKILEQDDVSRRHKLEVSDLNRMFGSALFEGLKSNQSITLLAYLISTHELMF